MSNETFSESPTPGGTGDPIQVMQILAIALTVGVAVFGGIAIVISLGKDAQDPFITYIAAGFGFLALLMRSEVPAIIARQQVDQLRKAETSNEASRIKPRLYGVYQTTMIIGFALLEGAALFCLIAYIVEIHILALIAAGVLLLIMLATFPTRTRVEDWVEDQIQLLRM